MIYNIPTTTSINSTCNVFVLIEFTFVWIKHFFFLGLTLYEVCSSRSLDVQKALISFVAGQYCDNSSIPLGNYYCDGGIIILSKYFT